MNLASLEQVTGLDPQTVVLVRFAALVGKEAWINGQQVEDARRSRHSRITSIG